MNNPILPEVTPVDAAPVPEKAVVHLYFLLDRSGSMETIQGSVVAGFNDFVESQKPEKDTEFLITLIKFDTQAPHEILYEAQPVAAVKRMTMADFAPRGGTPLYDATAKAIEHAKARKATHPHESIVFMSVTDGGDNHSHKFRPADIHDMTSSLKYDDWQFVYVGANQDAKAESLQMGYPVTNGANYKANAAGVQGVFSGISRSMTSYRNAKKDGIILDSFLLPDVDQVLS